RDADLAEDPLREPGTPGQLHPAVAAVGRPPEPRLLAAAAERVRVALCLPDRGVEPARVGQVEREVDRAGASALVEHPLPGTPAVARAVDPALLVRAPGVAECRDVHDVRVGRVDAHAADVAGVGQAEVAPGLPAVVGAVDAVAVRDVAPDRRLARAGVDD